MQSLVHAWIISRTQPIHRQTDSLKKKVFIAWRNGCSFALWTQLFPSHRQRVAYIIPGEIGPRSNYFLCPKYLMAYFTKDVFISKKKIRNLLHVSVSLASNFLAFTRKSVVLRSEERYFQLLEENSNLYLYFVFYRVVCSSFNVVPKHIFRHW